MHFHVLLFLCSLLMIVMDNLGEKLYCSSSNHAFPGVHPNFLIFPRSSRKPDVILVGHPS